MRSTATLLQNFERKQIEILNKDIPNFKAGDTITVGVKVVEGATHRIQKFTGVCIAKKNAGINSSFIVSKLSGYERVERTFQTYSTLIDSIKVERIGRVRRAKLYYLRDRRGKAARIREKMTYKKSS